MEVNKIYNEDCLEGMKKLPDNCIDSCVTDPPYLLEFMGKTWDKANEIEQHDDIHAPTNKYAYFHYQWAKEVLRILKPGGHLLSFGGTRTYHRMVQGIEDAGFEIRDTIFWCYGSGFPKSLSIGKAIDTKLGAEREVIGRGNDKGRTKVFGGGLTVDTFITAPATAAAKQWEGWGTALKPANEPIVLARKPLIGTVAENVLKYGTGGINIDECRVQIDESTDENFKARIGKTFNGKEGGDFGTIGKIKGVDYFNNKGRFPANLIMDEFMAAELDKMSGVSKSGKNILQKGTGGIWNKSSGLPCGDQYGDSGGASRYFYCAKSSKRERNEGLGRLQSVTPSDKTGRKEGSKGVSGSIEHGNSANPFANGGGISKNFHPTVKPIALMEYLVKLITPKEAICLDPFAGSGTTLVAAKNVGCNYIGYEKEEAYMKIIEEKFKNYCKQQSLF